MDLIEKTYVSHIPNIKYRRGRIPKMPKTPLLKTVKLSEKDLYFNDKPYAYRFEIN